MGYAMDSGGQQRMLDYFEGIIGPVLGNKKRRASFATYAMGLLGEGERKSMEPIAARAAPAPERVNAIHQQLGHFMNDSEWSDRAVRRAAASYGIAAMTVDDPISAWIFDDTGFIKQGAHSVGVQRQYTGSAGKVTNCQIGVSLSVATRSEHLPIDFELYLPESWTEDAARRAEARIPEDETFKTKPELALRMVDRAIEDQIPRGPVLADEAYGNSSAFRRALRERGLDYAVAIAATTTVLIPERKGGVGRVKWSVRELAGLFGARRFRRTTWREGTRGVLSARFAMRRVVVAHDDGEPLDTREQVWLLMEWRDGEARPEHFYLATLPKKTSRKKLVRTVKERYRTERAYEDLKGELGLDHFEGRRFPGWHHHVSVALCCYAFITAEKVRVFSPSARGARRSATHQRTTRAPLPGFAHHGPPGHCPSPQHLASPMPPLPQVELPMAQA
jgi:SRSO17 transposase